MFKKIAIASALALMASASFAQTAPSVYAGVDVGSTKADDFDGRETSYGVFAGYNFNQNFAIEGTYRSLYNEDDGDADQIAISGLAIAPMGNGWSVYGRLGYNRLSVKESGVGSAHVSKVLYGAGVGYDFTPTITGRLEIQKPHSDLTNISAGVVFKF